SGATTAGWGRWSRRSRSSRAGPGAWSRAETTRARCEWCRPCARPYGTWGLALTRTCGLPTYSWMSGARRRGSSCQTVVYSRCGCACRDSTTCAMRLRRSRWCTSWGRTSSGRSRRSRNSPEWGAGGGGGGGRGGGGGGGGGGGEGGGGGGGDAGGGGGGDGAGGRRRVPLGGGRYHACRTGAARTPGEGGGGGGGVTQPWPRWRQRALLGVAASALLVLSWLGAPFVLRRLGMFRVRQIELVGVRNLAPDAVIAALRLGPRASVFGDTRLLADRVRGLAGVGGGRGVRRLPAGALVRPGAGVDAALVPVVWRFARGR